MSFEQNRNAELHIISSAGILSGTFATAADVLAAMKANAIPGITEFGYDHEMEVQRRGAGQFGKNKPVGLTDRYNGVRGNFDVEGTDGENAVLAAINRIARASYVGGTYNKLHELFIIANVTEDDGAALKAHFVGPSKVDAVPKKVTPDAKRFSFQSVIGYDFSGKKIHYHVVDGAATPVVAIPYPTNETAVAFEHDEGGQRHALLVMRYNAADKTNRILQLATAAAGGFYTETADAVTLHATDGLAVGDKLLVAYLV